MFHILSIICFHLYREPRFFFDEEKSIYTLKTSIVNVIGHEFTHQWFGNLASPKWWSQVWLKEGFATLYSYYITHLVNINLVIYKISIMYS